MPLTIPEFEALAKDALPLSDDWGSERQSAAQNRFFDAVRDTLKAEDFAELESYCLHASTDEMIAEGLRLVRLQLTGRCVVHRIRTDTSGEWKVQLARTLLHITCGGVGVCSISVSANHVHEDYPGCKRDYIAQQKAFAEYIVKACNAARNN